MLKWLGIILVVFIGFTVILLSLGYLLKENEKQTTALKQQLDAEREQLRNKIKKLSTNSQQPISIELITTKVIKPSKNKQIIKENLTCVSSEQCLLVNVRFADLTCLVAVNTIGAAKLAKVTVDETVVGECQNSTEASQAVCQQNLCIIDG